MRPKNKRVLIKAVYKIGNVGVFYVRILGERGSWRRGLFTGTSASRHDDDYLRSASLPAPGFVASKSPPSAARPVVLTYCSPVPLLSSELSSSTLALASPPPSLADVDSDSALRLPASPPFSLAMTSSDLGAGPKFSCLSSPWAEESAGSSVFSSMGLSLVSVVDPNVALWFLVFWGSLKASSSSVGNFESLLCSSGSWGGGFC